MFRIFFKGWMKFSICVTERRLNYINKKIISDSGSASRSTTASSSHSASSPSTASTTCTTYSAGKMERDTELLVSLAVT
jgi:hypothetical protein